MISNGADKTKCVACETPKPGAAPPAAAIVPPPAAPPADDLFAKFMTKSGGKWSCDVCMVSNDADKTKCVACETPKPGAAPPAAAIVPPPAAPPADDLFAKFMTKSGGKWSCDVCMVSNDADKTKCVACETAKPGSAAPSTGSSESAGQDKPASFQFGQSGGFKFGSGPAVAATTQETNASATSGFSFGSSSTTEAAPASGGFKFGSFSEPEQDKSKKDAVAGFSFGSSTTTTTTTTGAAAPTGFSFGCSNTPTSGSKGFKFTDKMGIKIDTNTSDTPKTKNRKVEYHSNLKALNTQVTSWIKKHVDQNPLVDLTPVFKDYEKHIGELKTKYNFTSSAEKKKEVKDVTKTLAFGAPSSQSVFGSGSTGFSFGQSKTTEDKTETTTTTSIFQSTPFGSGSVTGFSFGQTNISDNSTVTANDNTEDDEAEETVVSPKKDEPVVEEDAVYSHKCKLFYKKDGNFVERGLGNIHLKVTEDRKVQLIIRAGTSLGNILLNIIVSSNTPLQRKGKNNVMLITVPNPPLDKKDEQNPTPTTFLIRVKTAEDADELKDKIDGLCQEN